ETGDGVMNLFQQDLPNGLRAQYAFLDSSLTDDVQHQVLASVMSDHGEWDVVDTLDELADVSDSGGSLPKLVIVDRAVTPDDAQAAVYRFGEAQRGEASTPAVLMRMELDPSVTAHVLISSPNEKTIPEVIATEKAGRAQVRRVNNPVPLQTQIRSLLHAGLSWPFDASSNVGDVVMRSTAGTADTKSLQELLRTMRAAELSQSGKVFLGKAALAAALKPIEREAALKKWLAAHTTHYANLLKMADETVPAIWLTRSGSSANDAVIRALAKALPEDVAVYKDESWYYENDEAVNANFTLGPISQAQVCFIGSSDASGHQPADSFEAKRAKILAVFKENALSHPERQFFLVIDTTFDPLVYIPRAEYPWNLTIIRTTSWTKYQRGERNHFCGSIAASGDGLALLDIEESSKESRAPLTEDGIVHMPRITQTELLARQERMRECVTRFRVAFEAAQLEVIPELRHTITWNTSCIYIQHPLFNALRKGPQAFSQLLSIMKEPASADSNVIRSGDVRRLNRKYFTLVDMTAQPFVHARRGESFGLPETRVDIMTEQVAGETSLREHLGLSPIQNLRVSPGYDEPLESMEAVAQELSRFLTRKYRDEFRIGASAVRPENVDFSRAENAWKFAHRLTSREAEDILARSGSEEQRRRILEYMDDVTWSRESYERLVASPVSTFVLSHVFSKMDGERTAADVVRFVGRKSNSHERPVLSPAFIRWCRNTVGGMQFSQDDVSAMMASLQDKEDDEAAQLQLHVLSHIG
ncbi:MAG: hypothetical protein RIQ56_177, partial [Candidatus Parcubacteria bacterium]